MNSTSADVDEKWIRDVPVDRRPVYKDTPFFRLCMGLMYENCLAASTYKPRSGDVFIATYPKNGTTWMQQIVYLIQHDAIPPNNFDELYANSVFFEQMGLKAVEAIKPPGSIKIHLAAEIAPFSDAAKYIVVVRNPKDSLVSNYNHHVGFDKFYEFKGNFDDFFNLFLAGQVEFGDYFHFVNSWLKKKHLSNVFFITYEQLKKNPTECIRKIAYFLDEKYGKRVDEDEKYLQDILHHSSLGEMKRRYQNTLEYGTSSGYSLVHEGISNRWRKMFTREQNKLLSQRFIEEAEKNPPLMTLWDDYTWLHDAEVDTC